MGMLTEAWDSPELYGDSPAPVTTTPFSLGDEYEPHHRAFIFEDEASAVAHASSNRWTVRQDGWIAVIESIGGQVRPGRRGGWVAERTTGKIVWVGKDQDEALRVRGESLDPLRTQQFF